MHYHRQLAPTASTPPVRAVGGNPKPRVTYMGFPPANYSGKGWNPALNTTGYVKGGHRKPTSELNGTRWTCPTLYGQDPTVRAVGGNSSSFCALCTASSWLNARPWTVSTISWIWADRGRPLPDCRLMLPVDLILRNNFSRPPLLHFFCGNSLSKRLVP